MRKCILITTLIALMAAPLAVAQPPKPPGVEAPRAERREAPAQRSGNMRQLFEQVMIARLSKDLDFNEEETILLVRRFIEFREGLQEVRRERERAVRSLERAVKNSNTEEIEKLLPRVLDLEEQLANAKRRMYDHLSADLDPERKGKLYLWLKDFEGDMRRLLQQARRRADHQPGPPPSGPHGPRPQRGPLPHHPDGLPPPHHPQGGPPEHLPPPPPGE